MRNRSAKSKMLACIVFAFFSAGTLKLGGTGIAIANETAHSFGNEPNSTCLPSPNTKALLQAIAERTTKLDEKESQQNERLHDLRAAQTLIENNLLRLAEAEKNLRDTIVQVEGASESDLERLTSVYSSMKPKVAAGLFELMPPEFAAGFLGRMPAEPAANIMSGLSSEAGYAISVVLAGRNAKAPVQ